MQKHTFAHTQNSYRNTNLETVIYVQRTYKVNKKERNKKRDGGKEEGRKPLGKIMIQKMN